MKLFEVLFKKILYKFVIVVILVFIPLNCFALNVNDNTLPYCDEVCKGARVSLYEVATQKKIKSIDMINEEYESASNYRILSKYSKIDIISFDGKLNEEIKKNIEIPKNAKENLYKYSVSFPDFFIHDNIGNIERKLMIQNWFANENFIKILFDIFNMNKQDVYEWNNGKVCLLVEPLVLINTNSKSDNKWLMTSAELGLCALNGMADKGELFDSEKLEKVAYYALPYGTYKEEKGLIDILRPYKNIFSNPINTIDGYKDMINQLGCLEMSIYNSIKVTGYTDVAKPIVETESIVIDETQIEKVINQKVINIDIMQIYDALKVKKLLIVILVVSILIIIILFVLFNKKEPNDNGMKKCNKTNCYYNKKGYCISDVINKWKKQCDKDNDYRYFEDRE